MCLTVIKIDTMFDNNKSLWEVLIEAITFAFIAMFLITVVAITILACWP